MPNSNNSFSVFLSIILGFLFVGSVIFSYLFGNFGGISLKELNSNYVQKNSLNFLDLPKTIQNKYINKDKLTKNKITDDSIQKAFDEDGNPIEVLAKDEDEYEKIFKSLQNRVVFLERENMLISNDKDELLKIVQEEKSKNDNSQKSLLSKNLEKINEAEQQHYRNISELTMKINDLQRENIRLSQQINGKDDLQSEQIEKLKAKIHSDKILAQSKEDEFIKAQEFKYAALSDENHNFVKKIDSLNEKIKNLKANKVLEVARKDQQITLLQNKINELMVEKNMVLSKNSQEILNLEKQNTLKLQEFNDIIKNNNFEKDKIKEKYKKEIEDIKNKYLTMLEHNKNEILNIKALLEKEKQNSIISLENSRVAIESINSKTQSLLKEADSKFINENKKLLNLVNENKKLLASIESQKSINSQNEDRLLQLQDKIKILEKNDKKVDEEVNELVKINEEKHNKNYKILNSKVAIFEEQIKSLQNKNSKNLEIVSNEKAQLVSKLNALYSDNLNKEKEIVELSKELEVLKNKKSKLELSENEKLVEIRKAFSELKASVIKREKEYEKIISDLKNDVLERNKELQERYKDKEKLGIYLREITSLKKTLKTFEGQIVGSKTVPISDKKRKLALIGSIECGDMNSGNFKISSTCKEKVNSFLSKYDSSHYFEVIPIVGTGGFASLNLIKRKSKLGIPDTEIQRLTELANLGLGKHRAKEGGWLIKEKFGENAKISYTVYNIESNDKRGFVIRVYR